MERPLTTADQPTIVLFAHGARDARWAATLDALRRRVEAAAPAARVAVAFLEFQAPTLPEALEAAARAGSRTITVAPVFWASGGHVTAELPLLVDAFRRAYPETAVRVLPALSELPGLLDFVAAALTRLAGAAERSERSEDEPRAGSRDA